MTTIGNNDTTGREAAIHINHIEGAIGHLANHCDGVYCSSLREAIDFISRHSDSRVEVLEKALKGLVSAIDVDPYECPQCGSRLPIEDVDKNSLQHNDGCELHAAHLALSQERKETETMSELTHAGGKGESFCDVREVDPSPSPSSEQVKELRDRVAHVLYEIGEDRHALTVESAAATIERLEAQLRYIDQRCEEQIQDRIRLGEALTLATRERDEARKVIERLDDVQLESLRTRFNQLGDEAQPGSVLDRFLDDVEACICASELARDFLSKQEGK